MNMIEAWLRSIIDLAEKYPGLGGWVGAIGSVLAVIAAWGLSRGEYLRQRREQIAERREGIDLMLKIVADFETFAAPYFSAARSGHGATMVGFGQNGSEPAVRAMADLAFIPVVAWPSLAAYSAFKSAWYRSTNLLSTAQAIAMASAPGVPAQAHEQAAAMVELKAALRSARP